MKIIFLTRFINNAQDRLLVARAKALGYVCDVYDIGHITLSAGAEMRHNGVPFPKDAVYFPFWVARDTYMRTVVQALATQGYVVTRNPWGKTVDKVSMAQVFAQQGLPQPKTVLINRLEDLPYAEDRLGYPMVAKKAVGYHGNAVEMLASPKEAELWVSKACAEGADFVLQEMLEPRGHDVRAFLVNGKVVAAMERHAQLEGEFRANIALGGKGVATTLCAEEEALVRQAAACFDLDIAGVDFMRTGHGPMLLEVNASPGLRGIVAATGRDVAADILDYVVHHYGEQLATLA